MLTVRWVNIGHWLIRGWYLYRGCSSLPCLMTGLGFRDHYTPLILNERGSFTCFILNNNRWFTCFIKTYYFYSSSLLWNTDNKWFTCFNKTWHFYSSSLSWLHMITCSYGHLRFMFVTYSSYGPHQGYESCLLLRFDEIHERHMENVVVWNGFSSMWP